MDYFNRKTLGLTLSATILLGGCSAPPWLKDFSNTFRGSSANNDTSVEHKPVPEIGEGDVIYPLNKIPGIDDTTLAKPPAEDTMQHTFIRYGEDHDPSVSPDGRWFVFSSTRHSKTSDIYIQSTDGKVAMKMTSHPASDLQPSFSPDGTQIAFTSNRGNGEYHIYILPIKNDFKFPRPGENPVKVKARPRKVTLDRAHHVHPTWSPDSRKLSYSRYNDRSGEWEIWVMDRNTEQHRQITEGLLPTWSPVGDRIAFQRFRDRDDNWTSIWTVKEDGTQLTEIVPANEYPVAAPSWSPDGEYLVYTSCAKKRMGERSVWVPDDIWMINVDGRHQTALTNTEHSDSAPSWRGKRLFYVSNQNGFKNIWSIAPYLVPSVPNRHIVDSR